MSLYRRGRIWWFHFMIEGHHYQESTHLTDKSAARHVEASRRLEVARAGVGTHRPGLFAVARELHHIAEVLAKLDGADAGTVMDAREFLSQELKKGIEGLRH